MEFVYYVNIFLQTVKVSQLTLPDHQQNTTNKTITFLSSMSYAQKNVIYVTHTDAKIITRSNTLSSSEFIEHFKLVLTHASGHNLTFRLKF